MTPNDLSEELRKVTADADEFEEVGRIANFMVNLQISFDWNASGAFTGRLVETAGGSGHFLCRGRRQGDHLDGAYGWSRNEGLVLQLAKLGGGHFDAFKFQSNSTLLLCATTNDPQRP